MEAGHVLQRMSVDLHPRVGDELVPRTSNAETYGRMVAPQEVTDDE